MGRISGFIWSIRAVCQKLRLACRKLQEAKDNGDRVNDPDLASALDQISLHPEVKGDDKSSGSHPFSWGLATTCTWAYTLLL